MHKVQNVKFANIVNIQYTPVLICTPYNSDLIDVSISGIYWVIYHVDNSTICAIWGVLHT